MGSDLETQQMLTDNRPDGPPDWNNLSEDVFCPLCEYNLRGLPEPRCPECGYRFTWREIMDPALRLHPWLFEHHPERNIWTFWKTLYHGLRPVQFWSSVFPTQASDPYRLKLYWIICTAVFLLSFGLLILGEAIEVVNSPNIGMSYHIGFRTIPTFTTMPTLFEVLGSIVTEGDFLVVMLVLLILPIGWMWMSYAALLVFRFSMRRAKIRNVHVLRACVYSFDGILWAGLLANIFIVTRFILGNRLLGFLFAHFIMASSAGKPIVRLMLDSDELFETLGLIWGLPMLFGIWRLRTAYARYLRFDHSWTTVLASQVIVFLTALLMLMTICMVHPGLRNGPVVVWVGRLLNRFFG